MCTNFWIVGLILCGAIVSSCKDQAVPKSLENFSVARFFGFTDPSQERLTLKGVHLDGVGLLNQIVFVQGIIQLVGPFETYMVIEEERVRMLVDLSALGGIASQEELRLGKMVEVSGKVQTGENGHVYLVASAISTGL